MAQTLLALFTLVGMLPESSMAQMVVSSQHYCHYIVTRPLRHRACILPRIIFHSVFCHHDHFRFLMPDVPRPQRVNTSTLFSSVKVSLSQMAMIKNESALKEGLIGE